jgi:cell cycle checkpoint control protein RAD9A
MKTDNNPEILKQPLKTTVVLNTADFESLKVEEKLHIVISVKDFRAIVMHAESIDVSLQAYYSAPGRPLQFTYNKHSMECQFTLMTAGEYRGPTAEAIERMNAGPQQTSNAEPTKKQPTRVMPPPPRPFEGRRNARTLGKRTEERAKSTVTTESDDQPLFVPQDDREWDPAPYDNGDEVLGWDASEKTVLISTLSGIYVNELIEIRNRYSPAGNVSERLPGQKHPQSQNRQWRRRLTYLNQPSDCHR